MEEEEDEEDNESIAAAYEDEEEVGLGVRMKSRRKVMRTMGMRMRLWYDEEICA